MPDSKTVSPDAPLLAHGADQLSLVVVDAYNAELRSADGSSHVRRCRSSVHVAR